MCVCLRRHQLIHKINTIHLTTLCEMLQVYGLLSNAAQWWFYSCSPSELHPVSFYTLSIDLANIHSVPDVLHATHDLLEHLLGFLVLCLEGASQSSGKG